MTDRSPEPVIRVLLADDQGVVRAGLRMILESERDIEVVGEAQDGFEACRLTRQLDPDIVLMDIRMPGLDGIAATRMIMQSSPSVKVVVLTTYDLDENVYDALAAGAAGFLVKTETPENIVEAVRSVRSGNTLLAPSATHRLVERFVSGRRPNTPPHGLDALTEREREVFGLAAEGLSNAEIGARLFVTEGTVKTHIARILAKVGLRDRVQIVVHAYESGFLEPRPSR